MIALPYTRPSYRTVLIRQAKLLLVDVLPQALAAIVVVGTILALCTYLGAGR